MSKRRVKGRKLDLTDFMSEGGDSVKEGFTVVQKKLDWAGTEVTQSGPMILPTASMSSRGGLVDSTKVPTVGPFEAYLGNLPFEVTEEDIEQFFNQQKVSSVNLVRDSHTRFKGFGYVEFEDRASLIAALNMDGTLFKTRSMKIGLRNESEDKGFGSRGNRMGGFGSRGERPMERDLPTDWRAAREESSGGRGSESYQRADGPERYGDRSGGFGRERSGDRGVTDTDWRAGGRPDRGHNNNMNNRHESSSAPAERPRLNIAPRTKKPENNNLEATDENAAEEKPKASSIFGQAKPVDTAAKLREIETNLEKQKTETTEAPRPKPEKPKAADIFGAAKPVDTDAKMREIEKRLLEKQKKVEEEEKRDEGEKKIPKQIEKNETPSGGRSWRDESREEKEKKKAPRSERRVPAAALQEDVPVVVNSKNKFADLEVAELAESDDGADD